MDIHSAACSSSDDKEFDTPTEGLCTVQLNHHAGTHYKLDTIASQALEENAILRAKLSSANRRLKELRDTMTLLEVSLTMLKAQAQVMDANRNAQPAGDIVTANHPLIGDHTTKFYSGQKRARSVPDHPYVDVIASRATVMSEFSESAGPTAKHPRLPPSTTATAPPSQPPVHLEVALPVSPMPDLLPRRGTTVLPGHFPGPPVSSPVWAHFPVDPAPHLQGKVAISAQYVEQVAVDNGARAAGKSEGEEDGQTDVDRAVQGMITRHEEKQKIDEFCSKVESGLLRIHQGDLARAMREFVNPARSAAYFEKLVSRESLNRKWQYLLLPRRPRRKGSNRSCTPEEVSPPVETRPLPSHPQPPTRMIMAPHQMYHSVSSFGAPMVGYMQMVGPDGYGSMRPGIPMGQVLPGEMMSMGVMPMKFAVSEAMTTDRA